MTPEFHASIRALSVDEGKRVSGTPYVLIRQADLHQIVRLIEEFQARPVAVKVEAEKKMMAELKTDAGRYIHASASAAVRQIHDAAKRLEEVVDDALRCVPKRSRVARKAIAKAQGRP